MEKEELKELIQFLHGIDSRMFNDFLTMEAFTKKDENKDLMHLGAQANESMTYNIEHRIDLKDWINKLSRIT